MVANLHGGQHTACAEPSATSLTSLERVACTGAVAFNPSHSIALLSSLNINQQVAEHRASGYAPPQPEADESFLLNNFHVTELVLPYLLPRDLCRLGTACKSLKGTSIYVHKSLWFIRKEHQYHYNYYHGFLLADGA